MEKWRQVQTWATDDDLDEWLKMQGLANSIAIIGKVIEDGSIAYASGTRRLRYAKGKFYLDHYFEERTDYGVGKHIDLQALKKRFQSLYPAAIIKVTFNKHPNACALSISEGSTEDKKHTYLIQFNPAKLRTTKLVAQRITEVEKELTE